MEYLHIVKKHTGGGVYFCTQEFIYLGYSKAVYKFQFPTMPGTGLNVYGGMVVVVVVWWYVGLF